MAGYFRPIILTNSETPQSGGGWCAVRRSRDTKAPTPVLRRPHRPDGGVGFRPGQAVAVGDADCHLRSLSRTRSRSIPHGPLSASPHIEPVQSRGRRDGYLSAPSAEPRERRFGPHSDTTENTHSQFGFAVYSSSMVAPLHASWFVDLLLKPIDAPTNEAEPPAPLFMVIVAFHGPAGSTWPAWTLPGRWQ